MTVKLHGAFQNLELFKGKQIALRLHLLTSRFVGGLIPLNKKVGSVLMIFDEAATNHLTKNLTPNLAAIPKNLDLLAQKFNNVQTEFVVKD